MKQKYSSKELREKMKQDELELLLEGTGAWFRRYGQALLVGTVIVVAGVLGYYLYQNHEKGQNEEAVKAYNAAAMDLSRGNTEQAALAFDRLAQDFKATGAASEARVAAAQAYFEKGDYDKAKARFQQLSQSKDSILASVGLTGLAQVAEAQGKREEAISIYKNAIDSHPDSGFVERWRYGIGYNYEKLGDKEKAVAAYRAVPDDSALKMQAVQRLAWLLVEPRAAKS